MLEVQQKKAISHRLNWPLALTLLRLLLVPVFLGLIIWSSHAHGIGADHQQRQRRYAALLVYIVMIATDLLDGFLARRLKQTTRLGAWLDPAADKILLSASLLLLCMRRYAPGGFVIPGPVVVGAYLKDIGAMIGAAVILARLGKVRIVSRLPGKLCTLVQMMLVMATLLTPELLHFSTASAASVFWGLWWTTVLVTAAAAADYAHQGALQLRLATA